jgi:uncharacterized protein with HEPN domain
MQPRDWAARIDDMIEAIRKATSYTSNMTFADFVANELVVEAARFIPEEIERNHPEIPWSKIRGIRNVVAHHYSGINLALLWTTVTSEMHPLMPMLQAILSEEPFP